MISSITNAQKAAFAIANKLSEPLGNKGIDKAGLVIISSRRTM